MDFKRQTISHHEDVYVRYDISKYKDVGRNRWDPYKDEPIINAAGLCYVWRRIVNSDESRQMALLELFEKHPKMCIRDSDYPLEPGDISAYEKLVSTLYSPEAVSYTHLDVYKRQL